MLKHLSYFAFPLIFTAIIAVLSFPYISVYRHDLGNDGQWYIKLSEGRITEVMQPFSGRVLYPFLAGTLQKFLNFDIGFAFFWLGTISLFAFFLLNSLILKKIIGSPLLVIPILFLPYFMIMSRELFLPDIFYAFLIALFFILLYFKKEPLSLIVLFLLFLTRETTLLLAIFTMVFSLIRKKKLLFAGALIVTIISIFTTNYISAAGLPNPHHVSNSFYIILKLTYNFFNNFFGIKFWANTLAENCEPVFRTSLPAWSIFGSIREAGLCKFNLFGPVDTLFVLLTVFGIAPLIFLYIFIKRFRSISLEAPFWVTFAAFYGIAQYFIGVPAGTGVLRIVGYGWPAFLLATPFLMKNFLEMDKNFIIKLSLVQLSVLWLPFLIQNITSYTIKTASISIIFAIPMYLWAFHLLKRRKIIDAVESQ